MSEAKELPERPSPSDFDQFFEETHGYGPFPWQEELVARVLDRGWPALIDVPTGLGKTAVLDVAVFLSALRSEHSRRRVFLVVDRRIIVDQAHEEAEKIRRALENPPRDSIRERVRASLAVSGDETGSVLDVTRMRGGVNWSWLWIERPDRHSIVTGTVDQIGSRLLFRGYGVGDRLRPIDAAMAGTDSLILIDEAHLSEPFFTTLRDVLAMDGGVGRPPIVVAMSASPDCGDREVHGITRADVEHPVAGQRLRAPKSLHAVQVTATAATATSAAADALAYWARQLGGPGRVIGVVANTVHMARRVFEHLRAKTSDAEKCVLLTGRVRPVDREYLLAYWYPRVRSGAKRHTNAALYVVATQTIEAGADIDLDGMVTQGASLPALVQRLGRLNRMGNRDAARAVVVHADKLIDPVYGSAAEQTWDWLTGLASPLAHKAERAVRDLGTGVCVSPAALRDLVSSIPRAQQERMRGEKRYVPMISRSALDAWARTSPAPHPDAPVAPYLHGIGAGQPTVSVVWRADLRGGDPSSWLPSVQRIPPSADEAIELPISAARGWLSQLAVEVPPAGPAPVAETGTSDLESQASGEAEEAARTGRTGPRVLRYRDAEECDVTTAQQLRPGDLLVVPSDWGGCDRYGWHPDSAVPVTDVADFTGWRGRRTAAIRIGSVLAEAVRVLAPDLVEPVEHLIAEVRDGIDNESVDSARYQGLLGDMTAGWQQPRLPHERVLSRLARARNGRFSELDHDELGGGGSTRIYGLFSAAGTSWNDDDSAAGSTASPGRERLKLAEHQAAVSRRAREFAANLNLPEDIGRAVERAALHHDEGKRDPRFQAMLCGGDRLLARAMTELLAKSGMDPADRAAFRRAARLSGYPSKMRHEALSARITRAMLEQASGGDLDRDLVVHLVAAHHGFARPLLPAVADEHPEKLPVLVGDDQTIQFDTAETVDWTGPERFECLCDRYGRWGLALLESIVRLADIWCSARSERCDDQS
jgi:CRISPR-associated endonuclease/helicase Cas3